ncbi:hypothetical protein EAH78_14630 [Pseudomonas arsenicoxydans]|uniref:Uncharacterized protein n=1 Tax=Pseudomonas arsenicoxydans TaxID=702115 RepID=A0A502HVN4_9PSED|nr:hypothetical protein EAH78_14630 [Pseudomonas arsenicoxydans]
MARGLAPVGLRSSPQKKATAARSNGGKPPRHNGFHHLPLISFKPPQPDAARTGRHTHLPANAGSRAGCRPESGGRP